MAQTAIRLASIDDLAALVELLADDDLGKQREQLATPPLPAYQHAFRAITEDPNQRLYVLDIDGRVAGCLQLSLIPGLSRTGMWRGQIESVRVHRDFRGGGFGRQLFEHAITQAQEAGCGLVQLTTDKSRPDALRFYQSLGFAASHEGMKLAL